MSLPSSLLRRLRQVILDAGRGRGRSHCAPVELVDLERARFFSGQLITAEDLAQDQLYFREKLRRHNRLFHGWGIVCGLETERDSGCMVTISSGYAIDAFGDEIVVPDAVRFDVCESGSVVEGQTGYLGVRCVEQDARPVATEDGSEHTRTREGIELAVLDELPSTYRDAERRPSDDEGWVILADVTVTRGEVSVETDAHRRYAVSC